MDFLETQDSFAWFGVLQPVKPNTLEYSHFYGLGRRTLVFSSNDYFVGEYLLFPSAHIILTKADSKLD